MVSRSAHHGSEWLAVAAEEFAALQTRAVAAVDAKPWSAVASEQVGSWPTLLAQCMPLQRPRPPCGNTALSVRAILTPSHPKPRRTR